eukprot:10421853-Alexandrium_andersonii.AAC.1
MKHKRAGPSQTYGHTVRAQLARTRAARSQAGARARARNHGTATAPALRNHSNATPRPQGCPWKQPKMQSALPAHRGQQGRWRR